MSEGARIPSASAAAEPFKIPRSVFTPSPQRSPNAHIEQRHVSRHLETMRVRRRLGPCGARRKHARRHRGSPAASTLRQARRRIAMSSSFPSFHSGLI